MRDRGESGLASSPGLGTRLSLPTRETINISTWPRTAMGRGFAAFVDVVAKDFARASQTDGQL